MVLKERRSWIEFIWLRKRSSGGLLKSSNEISGSTNGREIIDQLSDYQHVKKDSAP
jgi:hypothetical protein